MAEEETKSADPTQTLVAELGHHIDKFDVKRFSDVHEDFKDIEKIISQYQQGKVSWNTVATKVSKLKATLENKNLKDKQLMAAIHGIYGIKVLGGKDDKNASNEGATTNRDTGSEKTTRSDQKVKQRSSQSSKSPQSSKGNTNKAEPRRSQSEQRQKRENEGNSSSSSRKESTKATKITVPESKPQNVRFKGLKKQDVIENNDLMRAVKLVPGTLKVSGNISIVPDKEYQKEKTVSDGTKKKDDSAKDPNQDASESRRIKAEHAYFLKLMKSLHFYVMYGDGGSQKTGYHLPPLEGEELQTSMSQPITQATEIAQKHLEFLKKFRMTDNMKQREEELQHKLIEATKKVDNLSRALHHSTEMIASLHKFIMGDKKHFNQPLPEKTDNDANANLVDFKNRLQEIARHHSNDLQLISYAEKLMKELRHYTVDYGKGEFNLPEEKSAIPDVRMGVFRTSAKDIAAEVNRIHEHLKELQNELLTIEQQLGNSTPKQPKEKQSKKSSKR